MPEHFLSYMPRTEEQNREIREKTKNLILDSALKLFVEKGYHSASMSDIAKLAGVSKGLAYNYFESKQKIVEAIFQKVMDMFVSEYLPLMGEPDPFKQIDLMTDITFNWLKNSHSFWRMLFMLFFQPGILENSNTFMQKFYAEAFLMLESIFIKIGIKNYTAEARIYGALLDGTAIDFLADTNNYPLDAVIAGIKEKYSRKNLEFLKG